MRILYYPISKPLSLTNFFFGGLAIYLFPRKLECPLCSPLLFPDLQNPFLANDLRTTKNKKIIYKDLILVILFHFLYMTDSHHKDFWWNNIFTNIIYVFCLSFFSRESPYLAFSRIFYGLIVDISLEICQKLKWLICTRFIQ